MSKKVILMLIALPIIVFAWWNMSPLLTDKKVNDQLDPELEALLKQVDQDVESVTAIPEDLTQASDANYQTKTKTRIPNPTENNQVGPGQANAVAPILPEHETADNQSRPNPSEKPMSNQMETEVGDTEAEPTQNIVTKPTWLPRTEGASVLAVPTPAKAAPSVSAKLPITGTGGHSASGDIRVIYAPNETMVRYEDYRGTNGPDLRVYLATDLRATDFIDLGKAKGNIGNINYSVPSGVNINDYNYVLTWCRSFSTLFDYASINSK